MKVGIVGAGNVGSTTAYTLSLGSQVSEIVLVDKNVDKAHGEILDLRHGLPFIPYVNLEYGGLDALSGMDVIVLTAGIGRKPGETRLDLAKNNVGLFQKIIPEIVEVNKKAIYLVVSNPVDVLTYACLKTSGLNPKQIIGSGNVLDSARFRSMLGHYFKVDPANVHAYILGEHGDTSFPVWSQSFIGCTPLKSMSLYDEKELDEIFKKTKSIASQVIKFKGATYYAVSLGVSKIIQAIDLNQKRVLPVSTMLKNFYGHSDICLSLPTIISKKGVEEILNIPLDEKEKQLLDTSVETINKVLKDTNLK